MQEKESVKCKKGGFEPQKQLFGCTKVKVWHCESKGLALRNINKSHPRRSLRASAPVDADDRSREYEEEKRWGERGEREVRAPFFCVRHPIRRERNL